MGENGAITLIIARYTIRSRMNGILSRNLRIALLGHGVMTMMMMI